MQVVLVIVDIASGFTEAIYTCPGSRPTAELAKEAFELGWLTRAGPPTAVEQVQSSRHCATTSAWWSKTLRHKLTGD
eukprot:2003690-Pyramimonas_sp.AAC.1